MLAEGLIRVQRSHFAFDYCQSALGGGFEKVEIDFGYSSIFLHPLHEVLTREVLHNLELFIPIVHLFRINTEERH